MGWLPAMFFVLGSDPAKREAALNLHAPAILVDLEDSVPHETKVAARGQVGEFVGRYATSRAVHVRINGMDTPLAYDDLDAVVRPGLRGVVMPKVTAGWEVRAIDGILRSLEEKRGLPQGAIELTASIETAAGVEQAAEIARSGLRLRRLLFGAGDLSTDLGLEWPPARGCELNFTLLVAKTTLVLASRQANLDPPLDGVYPLVDDLEGLRRQAKQSKALGFFGKLAIHPDQLPEILNAFRPSPSEMERARRFAEALERAEPQEGGAVDIGGKFIDRDVAIRARELLRAMNDLATEGGKITRRGCSSVSRRKNFCSRKAVRYPLRTCQRDK